MKTILLVEDDPEYQELLARSLESEEYYVLRASTKEEAEEQLRKRNIHLVIIDICLKHTENLRDKSGLELARYEEFRSIPKIMVTGYPSVEFMEETMQGIWDGYHIVSFITKGKKEIIQTIEDVFTKYVRINWGLKIRIVKPLSLFQLMNLIDPKVEYAHLLDRTNELEDLFRKLFYDYTHIVIGQMITQADGGVILKTFAHKDRGPQEQFVISCGRRSRVKVEEDHYDKFVPKAPTIGNTSKEKTKETSRLGATPYKLNDADLEETMTFGEFYQGRSAQEVMAALEYLYSVTLAKWHEKGQSYEGRSLTEFYLDRLKLSRKTAQVELEERVEALCQEFTNAGLARLQYSAKELTLHLSDGAPTSYRNPISYLFSGQFDAGSPVPCGSIYGQLNGAAVQVDLQNRTWLIDFSQAADKAPLLHDFVSMEAAIKFELLTTMDIKARLEMEKRLLLSSSLGNECEFKDLEPEVQKAIRAITQVRKKALAVIDHPELNPYLTGLFFFTISQLTTYKPHQTHLRHELVSFIHILLSAAILGQELVSLSPHEILLDVANRKVRVGRVEVPLPPQELELLRCLCEYQDKYPDRPCPVDIIAKEVFPYQFNTEKDKRDRVQLLISRLRKKIDPNPKHPTYIETVRGAGFKLKGVCKLLSE